MAWPTRLSDAFIASKLTRAFIRRMVLERPIPDELFENLRKAAHTPPNRIRATTVNAPAGRPTVTPAIWETLKLVAAGHSTPEIARRRGVTFYTAQDQVKRVLAVFDARDRMEVVTRCYREGIM